MHNIVNADKFPAEVIGNIVTGSKTYCTEINCLPLCFSPYVISGNYPLQIFLLFVLTVHADGRIISPTIDSSLVKVWPRAILLDAGPGLRIVLDKTQWLKARKPPMGLPLTYNTHSFLTVVIRAQLCGAG